MVDRTPVPSGNTGGNTGGNAGGNNRWMDGPLRVGFLGAGFIARYHARRLAGISERLPFEWGPVFDPTSHRADRFAEATGATRVGSEDEVFDGCDAVFVCTWTSEHPRLVGAAAQRGLSVFCEKPLAVDLAGARAIASEVRGAGVTAMVGLVLRSAPALVALRALINDPAHGRILNVVFRDDQYLPTQGIYRSSWRGDAERAGRGTLLEHSIHDLDILEWLFGPLAWVAATERFVHGLDRIEDSVAVLARCETGVGVTLTSVWHDLLDRPSSRRLEVLCERALVVLEGDTSGSVTVERPGERFALSGSELDVWLAERGLTPMVAEERFLRCVAGEAIDPDPSVDDALRAHVLVDAVYRSAATDGQRVALS